MNMNSQALIDQLSEDMTSVRPLSVRTSRLLALGGAALTTAAVLLFLGIRADIAAGDPSPVILLVAGLFALTAISAGITATRLAQPAVGGRQGGALWMAAAIGLLPAISLVEYLLGVGEPTSSEVALRCLYWGIAASLVTLGVLTWRLRQGAPVLPERAGLFAGLAAGAVGAFAITLECNNSQFVHLALSHAAIVATMALAGRALIPRIIRW